MYNNLANQQQNFALAQTGGGWDFWSSLLGNIGVSPYRFVSPDTEGWYDYCTCPAPPNALCQFKQDMEELRDKVWVGYSRDFRPEFNVANLKWRYTGIAREERGL